MAATAAREARGGQVVLPAAALPTRPAVEASPAVAFWSLPSRRFPETPTLVQPVATPRPVLAALAGRVVLEATGIQLLERVAMAALVVRGEPVGMSTAPLAVQPEAVESAPPVR